jgi:DHA1 family tetracycline resistance protein-like MFS transporter
VLQNTFVLYADYRYHWGAQAVGFVLALVGACDGSVQAFLTGKLTTRFGERPILITGLVFGTLAFAVMGLASTGWVFLIGIPLMSLWGLAGPPMQSIMTRCVSADQQGRLQGAITSLGSFAGIFGPYLFAQIFAFSIAPERQVHVPGIAFLLAAVLIAAGAVVAARATRWMAAPADPP